MTEHTQRKHARLSASRADRFVNCPGSVQLENRMAYEASGPAAQWGTDVHELSESIMRNEEVNAAKYEQEQIDMAHAYIKYIDAIADSPRKKLIEVSVDEGLKSLHPALGGTADAVIVDGNTMHVVDLKTGRVFVNAEENLQLMTYALGAMRQFNAPAAIEVVLHIFQPRAGSTTWHTTGARLIEHGLQLKRAAELALSKDAPTNPGSSQCKYCRAKPICPSLREQATEAARSDFKPDTVITPEMLDTAYSVTAWAESIIEAAKRQMDTFPIEGWTMRAGRKTRFWSAQAMVEEAMRDNPAAWELKSPAAVAKLGIELADGMVGEKLSAPSLVKSK
jgi:CRISPR/Cas system-associated exonuclease Cas4 (RecB family)